MECQAAERNGCAFTLHDIMATDVHVDDMLHIERGVASGSAPN